MAIYKTIYCKICKKNCYYKFIALFPQGIDYYVCCHCYNRLSAEEVDQMICDLKKD